MMVDVKKAYDKMDWWFLYRVLQTLGILELFKELIASYVNMVQYSIFLNGRILEPFNPRRGLRQGEPISPYIFIICLKFLLSMFAREEQEGHLHGIKIEVGVPMVSHLLYIDDLLVACKANEQDATITMTCFNQYCCWLRQEANLQKSNLMLLKGTSKIIRRKIKEITSFKESKVANIYLENSLILESIWVAKDRVQKKLEG